MEMRIAYLTTDELNRELAARAAKSCGADLDPTRPRTDRTPGPSVATIYDLDHLEAEHRQAVLDDLLSGRSPSPAAVHSYDLQDEVVAALHARGVVVSRRIGPEVFQQLCRLAASHREVIPDGDDPAREPDGDDPAALGSLVRSLASSAHCILRRRGDHPSVVHPDASAGIREQLDQLQRCIDRLRRRHNLRLEELQRWASNLRRLVDEHL
jgi:hypothetical protein